MKQLGDGDYVVIAIADTGVGILCAGPRADFRTLFSLPRKWARAPVSGCRWSYGFAQQSGGAVLATSTPGTGTLFELWLPKADAEELVANAKPDDEVIVDAAMNILLVDDHPAVRAATHAILDDLGHNTISAASAEDALEMLRQNRHPVDLLITDYAMPNMSGLELINSVRQWKAHLPAIIITGYADQSDLDARPGDVTVLSKPFDDKGLQRAINAVAPAI